MEKISWKIIDKYFQDNPYNLVSHHLDSYNSFLENEINKVFKDNNPFRFIEKPDKSSTEPAYECLLYMGGREGKNVYFSKPIIYDDDEGEDIKYMYPNVARLRNMTYGINIYYDIEVEFIYYKNEERIENTLKLERVFLCKLPIMMHSNPCILKGLPVETRFSMGECLVDCGGYFIIDGKEKIIVSQEKFADNMIYIKTHSQDSKYIYSAEIRSVSEDPSKPIRTTSVNLVREGARHSNLNIVVLVPNVRMPVPLFILMRALGVVSDKSIIEHCLLSTDNNELVDLFIPSVHDAAGIFTQQSALEYIKEFTKRRTIAGVMEILMDYFIPHIGVKNFSDKAFFLGHMVYKMLRVYKKIDPPTDRDNFMYKRIELPGTLIYQLFRDYYIMQKKDIERKIDTEFYFHVKEYKRNFESLIQDNHPEFFKPKIISKGIRDAFKGNWGATPETKKIGALQALNRLSSHSFLSHLRKLNLPLDPTAKVTGPRHLHSSQWGYIDPVDTPDGGNCGLHKHMAISTYVTSGTSSKGMIEWLHKNTNIKKMAECNIETISEYTKIFVNGILCGVLDNPIETIELFKLYRRIGVIPTYNSISFSYNTNEIYIYTDSGRLTRPLFYVKEGMPSWGNKKTMKIINESKFNWTDIVNGFKEKTNGNDKINTDTYYQISDLYNDLKDDLGTISTLKKLESKFEATSSIVDYLDCSEESSQLIAITLNELKTKKYATHLEIHPSLLFGILGNSVIFPEHNPLPRNVFSCGQTKQAVSVYHTNHSMRIDKMGVVLNYGQTPLVKSRYLKYINNEKAPYGVNTIVAIMSYTGYNVEDAILINKGAIDRGLFRTTYFTMYESYEQHSKAENENTDVHFADVLKVPDVRGVNPKYDYSYLNESGIIKEGTEMTEDKAVIGKITRSADITEPSTDSSIFPKRGQLGVVDKAFMTDGEEGTRIAKVKIRDERTPAIGDKMASRAGQKGTIGLIIPEKDMPYAQDGSVPDLIINPHAIPSRMTIGQFLEVILGRLGTHLGGFGDCTAYTLKGSNTETFGEVLIKNGFHAGGNQVMYSGFTGEQLTGDIFIGPTYYMRLKHMVKDKINYRADGPKTLMTRQAVQGRANNGGLRIGEMERDGIMAHGASSFLNDAFMNRADEYYMAICNKTGAIAVYNKEINLMMSPHADGPLHFDTNFEGNMNLQRITHFGRSFSLVRVPYSFKLLLQELQVMNIHMKIITSENIDHMTSMSYSNNINKLMKNDANLSSLFTKMRNEISRIPNILKDPVSTKQVSEPVISGIPLDNTIDPNKVMGDSDSESYHPVSTQSSMEYVPARSTDSMEFPGTPGGTPPAIQIARAEGQNEYQTEFTGELPVTPDGTPPAIQIARAQAQRQAELSGDLTGDPIENKDIPDISQFELQGVSDSIPQVDPNQKQFQIKNKDIAATFDSLTPEDQEKLMKVASIMETKEEVEKRKQESSDLENDKNVVISISTQPMKEGESSLPMTEEQKGKTLSILKVDEPKTDDEKEGDDTNDTNEKDGVGGTKKISFDL